MSFLRRLMQVPDTWEAWAVRVLTVMLAIVLLAVYVLLGKIGDLEDFVNESRDQRILFQNEEAARQCAILVRLQVAPAELEDLRC